MHCFFIIYVEFLNQLNLFTTVVLATFILTVLIQLLFYGVVYLRVAGRKTKSQDKNKSCETPPVSVIICARNEQENLTANLTSVLEQDYPNFEVIVVNDCSDDDTEQVLAGFKQQYPQLRSTIIKMTGTFKNGKKFAATVGIKAAQHEWLLFTDADCKPCGPNWIKSMSRNFIDKKGIVLGYGGYLPQKGYLNKWIRYDTCFIAMQYFGFAMAGIPYMGVGRNLAYRKSLFYAHNGFAAHAHILSGDDDLFVNQAATGKNVAVEYSSESHTQSVPKKTFREWIRQKNRHISTSVYYKRLHSFLLGLEPVSRVLMWGTFCTLMIQSILWEYILMIFLLRMVVFLPVFGLSAKKFNERGLLPHAVFFDLAMPFVYLYVFLLNRFFSKQNKW